MTEPEGEEDFEKIPLVVPDSPALPTPIVKHIHNLARAPEIDKSVSLSEPEARGLLRDGRPVSRGPITGEIAYKPHRKQRLFGKAIDEGAKVIVFQAGVRSGKTFAGAYECLKLIYNRKALPNLGYIVAPTAMMARVPRRIFVQAAGDAMIRFKRASDSGPAHCLLAPSPALPTHHYIVEFHSGTFPDRMRGASVAWAWLDEAAYMSREVYEVVLGRVMENDGAIMITTTPLEPGHWLNTDIVARSARCAVCDASWYDHPENADHSRSREPSGERRIAIIKSSTFDNVYLRKSAVEQLRQDYSVRDRATVLREIYGEFSSHEGMVYAGLDRKTHRTKMTRWNIPNSAVVIAGIDFGIQDPFVVVFGTQYEGSWHLFDEYYWVGKPRTVSEHYEQLMKLPHFKRVERWWYDPSAKGMAVEFKKLGLKNIFPARKKGYVRSDKSWMSHRIELMISLINGRTEKGIPKLLFGEGVPRTFQEFELRRWKRKLSLGRDGKVRIMDSKGRELEGSTDDEPVKGGDHAIDGTDYLICSEEMAFHPGAKEDRYQASDVPQVDAEKWAASIPVEMRSLNAYLQDSLDKKCARLFSGKRGVSQIRSLWNS